MMVKSIKLIIESKIENVPLVSKAGRAICNTVVQDEILLYNLELCLFEGVMNVINHSYHQNPGNFIDVIVTLNKNDITFHVIDIGDFRDLPIPKKELFQNPKNFAFLPNSGIGLFLIHRIMNEVSLKKIEEKNVLLMKKYIDQKKQL